MSVFRAAKATIAVRRFKTYPAYRNSEVEWTGDIPSHWRTARISELITLINGYPFDSEYFTHADGVPLVRIRDLNNTVTEANYVGPIMESAWIEPGDVIVGMDGEFNVAHWNGPRALLNQRMCCVRPRSEAEPRFIAYLLPFPLKVINDITYSTTVKHLSSADVRKIKLGAPSEAEQSIIADFLDRETAKIDALVAENERLIALLQENRAALITRAVTKGLNSNAPMKNSGIDWLGEIPAHWDLTKMWRISRAISGGTPAREEQAFWDGGIPWISAKDMKRKHIDSSEDTITERAIAETGLKLVAPPVVLIVVRGMILAHTFPVAITSVPVTINQDMKALQFKSGVAPEFMTWLFDGIGKNLLASIVEEAAHGTRAIRMDEWRSAIVPIPPKSEQQSICAFLERETASVDTLVSMIGNAVDKLKEFRTALISAAVTGKIDVREEAA